MREGSKVGKGGRVKGGKRGRDKGEKGLRV